MPIQGIEVKEVEGYISIIVSKTRKILSESGVEFPYGKAMGSEKWVRTEHCDWSGGHWIGLLLETYNDTKDKKILESAEALVPKVKERNGDEDEFLGFINYYSLKKLFDLTKKREYRDEALRAANVLRGMYNKKAGMIPLGDQCKIIGTQIKGKDLVGVDDAIIPNILLYWANEVTGISDYSDVARNNVDSITKNLVRDNGSTGHMLELDPETGEVAKRWNNLGYSDETTWSRGLAWTLLSYAYASEHFGDVKYVKLFNKSLNFYLQSCGNTMLVPFYDVNDPNIPSVPKDTTSLSIMAEAYAIAFQNGFGDESLLRKIYRSVVSRIDTDTESDIIMCHGCFDYPRRYLTSADLIFSDFYVMDFLKHLKEACLG